MRVLFLHPDLGIGGAERAVIDAALALKSKGHEVQFVTAHHDRSHCFTETKDGTLTVTSVGDWLPRSILGRCYALCAYIRMIYAALYLVYFSTLSYDVVFCDQISACIPILRLSLAKVIFYCHFPDMLLTKRETLMKSLYRRPLDWLEEKTTGMADCVLVNSKFTAGIFRQTFTSLGHISPQVLYPIPDFSTLDKPVDPPSDDLIPQNKEIVFLSINRYERKKNLALAIQALAKVKKDNPEESVHLVMAGGYDERVVENKEYYKELQQLAENLQCSDNVTFLRSFSDSQKRTLLKNVSCLLYTPQNEHFGIVPIEAMYMKCPVIAANSGGPLETVVNNETGFLCDPKAEHFSTAMIKFTRDKNLSKKLGANGRSHVIEKFSFVAFTDQLDGIVSDLGRTSHASSGYSVMWLLSFLAIIGILLVFTLPVFNTT
ncbi:hypothetical protein FSP39_012936 [Pinctada imbricata]|uniref:Alpha-1,3/1,6-mannosyltransferase ALG2 n=1 Tax=Pinctada imbricata TaxID=66713 RepID=A0AA88Y0T4_PINIB|nr:hypothetical protein FSP39_012936 [Pinctada imbricata]